MMFSYWECFVSEMRIKGLSFRLSPGKLSCVCFDRFLVRGMSLPVAQLVVVAIESILRRGVGNLTGVNLSKLSLRPVV